MPDASFCTLEVLISDGHTLKPATSTLSAILIIFDWARATNCEAFDPRAVSPRLYAVWGMEAWQRHLAASHLHRAWKILV
ncbi:uncharacterized protein N7500_009272 [Penicillium coprophilum]|uniref:uncharacterized protein n=1 Tax=Penicillium coprophilum TaxID=36646 RepID=UPI002388D5B4|nr:uncharacterized protein N7500_009272 [Penicillium coprophilum]KAJ5153833.1 hypothetical protein N7500_009272 [Penicillium coprophilum]